ncbi:MAG TPA: carbohydrate ABC transporter permease [Clostridiales bacterium]|jgi:putative aldouronate transport system permease protein|nr:carbohydrate ABC transporter permease [Clostridiales bacterium]
MKKQPKTSLGKRGALGISTGANAVINVIMVLISLSCLLPILLIYVSSFTAESAIRAHGFSLFPKEWSLSAYQMLFEESLAQIVVSYRNTAVLTVVGTVLSLFIMTMYAYAISRQVFAARKALTFFAYFTMLFSGGLVPSYIVNTTIFGLRDNMLVLLLPSLVGAYNIIVLRTFFSSADNTPIIEAAKVDGASEFRIYGQIILPISKPALATIGLFTAIAYFSKWFEVMLYIDSKSKWTIQYMLQRVMQDIQYLRANPDLLMSEEGAEMLANLPNESAKMALTVLTMTPVLAFYPYFQKYFVKGLTLGAVKG